MAVSSWNNREYVCEAMTLVSEILTTPNAKEVHIEIDADLESAWTIDYRVKRIIMPRSDNDG
jgi:hypothetical protein